MPGSYLTPSGGTGDGLGARRTVPTASGARRDDPRHGKRVNPFPTLIMLSMIRIRRALPAPPWAATDRACGAIGRVWIDTN